MSGSVEPVMEHDVAGKLGGRGKKALGITKSFNDAEYAIRRLKRDRPDLAKRVIDGDLSPHAAAIEAGFRAKRVTVNTTY